MARNLYVHFPFCRSKCAYCALFSRAGSSASERAQYVRRLAEALSSPPLSDERGVMETVYFGGGTPALCDLSPLFSALEPLMAQDCEFTVELNPRDVTPSLLDALAAGGVNRISMGVQSLDDKVLAAMGRGHAFGDAERAFEIVRRRFDNCGIDLIAGYPGDARAVSPRHERLLEWGLAHCSVYSLMLEKGSALRRRADADAGFRDSLPGDDETMDAIRAMSRHLASIGLCRYEISNYALPGRECRHNLAVWRGEDYYGLGEGAHGRIGLLRTRNWMGGAFGEGCETASPESDEAERRIFALRTRYGLDAAGRDDWMSALDAFEAEGLVSRSGTIYRLTERGTEVCDTVLAALV